MKYANRCIRQKFACDWHMDCCYKKEMVCKAAVPIPAYAFIII